MKNLSLLFLLLLSFQWAIGQDDLLNELNKNDSAKTQYTFATFKGTRIINGQSVEGKRKGELEFIFSHRFGKISDGVYTLWGLDDAFVRLGLEYGVTDRLGVSLGRTSVDKTFDGFIRYKILRQSTGEKSFPFSMTALTNIYYKTDPKADENPEWDPIDRLSYAAQVVIARKFSTNFSFQLNPIYIHRNSVNQDFENNDDIALGLGTRYKFTKSMALTAEYFLRLNEHADSPNYDAIGIGIDIETGGHVFQLVFTNANNMVERGVIPETTGDFFGGDIHFGFNITRTFQLSGKK